MEIESDNDRFGMYVNNQPFQVNIKFLVRNKFQMDEQAKATYLTCVLKFSR